MGMLVFIIGIGLGIITGHIAGQKGYNPWLWGFFGFMAAIIALPVILIMQPKEGYTKEDRLLDSGDHVECPECAEIIKARALVCRYCKSRIEQ
jgi:hypothetical protein